MTVDADSGTSWLKVSMVIQTLDEARDIPHVFAHVPAHIYEVTV